MSQAVNRPDEPGVWGGLTVAGMRLALPLPALREVLPLGALTPLPCASRAVAGALAVRGVTMPVIDLATLLGRESSMASATCVVIVVHEQRLIGLLADAVTGVFMADAGGLPPGGGSSQGTPFGGSLQRADTRELVDRLALPALAAMDQLPWIADPEPARQWGAQTQGDTVQAAATSRCALMLVRTGRLAFALDAMLVHATLWSPRIEASVLGRGACRGTLAFDGLQIAAVDLAALCGIDGPPAQGAQQAVVVRHPAGLVALLVGQVLDVIDIDAAAIVPLPSGASAMPALCRGVFDARALPPDAIVQPASRQHDYLVLDADALLGLEEVGNLAQTNTTSGGSAASPRRIGTPGTPRAQGAAGPRVITFRLPVETAVAMEQVREILPYGDRDAMFGGDNPLRRIQVLEGRSLPVYCLARLSGGTVERVGPAAAVLVVEVDGQPVGFGVPELCTIEQADWEQTLPSGAAENVARQPIVSVGHGAARRTLRRLDLHAIGRSLREPAPGLAA